MKPIALLSFGLLLIAGCSSAPPPPPPATTQAAAPTGPELINAGFEVETATALATIQSVDPSQRILVLKRPDGTTARYKAGTNMVNFAQLKTGDEVVATVTEDCAFFVVKGPVLPGVAGGMAVARAPKGAAPGGMFIDTIDYNATVLDVDYDARRVLLKYSTNDAKSVRIGPNVDLAQIRVGDSVLVRGSEAMAITVVKP